MRPAWHVVTNVICATVVAVGVLLAGVGRAEARPRASADDAVMAKLLGHADKLSALLEQHADDPKAGLAAIDKYLKKQRKPMKKLVTQLVGIAGDLDGDDRSAMKRDLLFSDQAMRFLAALGAFYDKYGDDPT
ncbi:MAG: hypothetical protein KC464_23300, partial [Myxococcales bacterium]|nr:hypothetical protein [Myxococcales bacterium]